MENLLPVLIITAIVAVVLNNQIRKTTLGIDQKEEYLSNSLRYTDFINYIQEKLRFINLDVKDTKSESSKFILKQTASEENCLEEISNIIRRLVFIETMNSRNNSSSKIESELFEILDTIDKILRDSFENGDELADELKDELFREYEKIQ